jgi:Ni/Co efflux regulator RcnB
MTRISSLLIATTLIAGSMLGAPMALGQTPEQAQLWEAQSAQRAADEKAKAQRIAEQRQARKADPMAWVRTLNPMTAGGWQFRSVASDGSWANFSTEHQMKRSGHLVTLWLRQEYPEMQKSANSGPFLSNVEKITYDCAKERGRVLLVIYYTENNLAGAQQSEEADEKQVTWDPIVPGTQSENVFQWACNPGRTPAS